MEKNNSISSDLIRGHIDTIILHTLLDGDKFAGQIIDFVDKKSSGEYIMNQATLYSSLKRLESLKQVSSYWFDSDGGRRKYFEITDIGRKVVEENLSNWSYSRGIIDKLMDLEQKPIYKTQFIEVEKEVIKEVPVPVAAPIPNPTEIKPQNTPNNDYTTNTDKPVQPEKEINYRSVLDGIIKSSVVEHKDVKLEPVKTEIDKDIPKEIVKPKLNDTLASDKYNTPMNSNVGKIDFGDIVLKATTEGYKVKISSKNLGAPTGKTFINRINLVSSLAVYLVVLLQFVILTIKFGDIVNFNSNSYVIPLICFALFPIVNLVKFFVKPKKTSPKNISVDIIFTALIIVFNLILVTFACNLLFETDFTSLKDVLVGIVVPTLLCLDVFVYYVFKYFASKFKNNKVK